MNIEFWRGKRVLITGHTGFKGSWLSLWLQSAGAQLLGYALPPPSSESLFHLAEVGAQMDSEYGDIRDRACLQAVVNSFHPEIAFHLAAQPIVRRSYSEPVETYEVNVMGTVHLLEALRSEKSCRVILNITSDKCYDNKEWPWSYRENDPLGGYDPYSSSKGCAELVTAAYRRSFFTAESSRPVGLASARAGNVIGGGDFSKDRIIPDFMATARTNARLVLRNPDAIRPWQHVLDPVHGYLLLAEKLWEHPTEYAQSWNFGPSTEDARPVRWIVDALNKRRTRRVEWTVDAGPKPHEAQLLMLDSSKARMMLDWNSRWTLDDALQAVADWYDAYDRGEPVREITQKQIAVYETTSSSKCWGTSPEHRLSRFSFEIHQDSTRRL